MASQVLIRTRKAGVPRQPCPAPSPESISSFRIIFIPTRIRPIRIRPMYNPHHHATHSCPSTSRLHGFLIQILFDRVVLNIILHASGIGARTTSPRFSCLNATLSSSRLLASGLPQARAGGPTLAIRWALSKIYHRINPSLSYLYEIRIRS